MQIIKFAAVAAVGSATLCLAQEAAPVALEESKAAEVKVSALFASGMATDEGFILSEKPVFAYDVKVATEAFGVIPLELGVWANYDLTDGKKNDATKDHCFTEIDLTLGTSFECPAGIEYGVQLTSYQYPNSSADGEESLLLSAAKKFDFGLIAGFDFEYMLTGGGEKDMYLAPYIGYEATLDEESNLGVELLVRPSYCIQDIGSDAWLGCMLKAQVNYGPFFAYVKHWVQIEDKIYTDEMNDKMDTAFGIGYQTEL